MRILRLAFFNLKKHKTEAVSLFLLILLCMTLLASAVSGISGIDSIFENAMEKTECVHNYVYMEDKYYKDIYNEYFGSDSRVSDYFITELAGSDTAEYIDKNDKKNSLFMTFITEENDAYIEKLITDSESSYEDMTAGEHYVLLPFYAKDTLKYKVGDTFNVVSNEKIYPFEVAGFYESGFFSDGGDLKLIVSRKDYNVMSNIFGKYRFIGFESENPGDAKKIISGFRKFADENAIGNEAMEIYTSTYEESMSQSTQVTKLLMGLMIFMSVVIFASIAFMIRFRIKNDIDEQMVSIGVLEALGYKSGQISLSYVLEYMLITLPAVIFGILLSFAAAPLLLNVGEILTGHHGAQIEFGIMPVILGAVIIAFVSLISFFRAMRIRKLPPVVAFRKGTGNHTHRKNVLPLEKTKTNVHIRLAAKDFLSNMKSNIGMGACISFTCAALMVCFIINDFAGNGIHAIAPLAGLDLSDVSAVVTVGNDAESLIEEIEAMPEVRTVNLSNVYMSDSVKSDDYTLSVLAYKDYDSTENIRPSDGRLPKHDNEVMIKRSFAAASKKKVGDTLTLKIGKIEADYVICGIVNTIFQVGDTCYMTDDGYKRLSPSYYPTQLNIFLKKGADKEAFKTELYSRYGSSKSDNSAEPDSLEERIREEADEKMSAMLEMYGVNYLDYSIQVGDKIISGNSSAFKIKSHISLSEYVETMLANVIMAFSVGTGIFMVISVFTILIIVFLVVHSAVKKQRNELGVLKGMGYTSRELMLQASVKIIPVLVFSVIIGSIIGIGLGKLIYMHYGNIPVVAAKVILLAAAVVLFGFATAYFSARKIKNISVYELMQE